jgi:photosystem II stability/assembly factor-like uncharacterized protein
MSRRFASHVFVYCLVLFLLVGGLAAAQQYNESLLKGMKWRLVGPFRGGRVLAVTGIPGDPETFYFGGVAGGVWRTTDGGITWVPLFEKQSTSSIGAIAVSEANPSVIYVGSGEACIRGNISYGDGVYKSTDGGKSWKNLGLKDTRHIARVLVHPRNPDLVYVAALGHAYGPNTERGVFRSSDGGKTWEKVLYRDDKTGAIDLTFDPHNPNVLYAALYQVVRTPWSLTSGGPGSGLYKSVDGGTTWKPIDGKGFPKGILGRIGVAVSGADSNRVYALVEAEKGGLFTSDDAGETWTRTNDDQRLTQRAWYFTHIFADPKSVDTLYVLNTGLFRSTDGGKSLTLLPAPHGDHHGLWIDPTNPQRMINGNDGGATITVDGGKSWSPQGNQPTAQFYHVAADNRFQYYLYGAQQDNTTVGIASRTDDGYIGRQHWYDVGGGESGYIVPDPREPNIVYAGSGGGYLTRFDKRTGQTQDITVWPVDSSGHGAKDVKYRQAWTNPILISPHDPDVLYTSAEIVFKSTDHGQSWTPISPDLTRNDKSKQESSGGPLTKDNTTVEYYDTVFTLAESPLQKDLIWAGTDDGLIHLTRDGGKNWTNVTPKDLPQWSLVSLIEASPHNAGTAYAAVDGHKLDDLRPYIFKTADFGKTWTRINSGLPEGAYVHAVREDPKQKGLLYAGTELGIYVSFDDGAHWQSLQLNLPTTPIHDLVVKNDDLAVATHGRSFWILDDIAPLRQLSAQASNWNMHLFAPSTAFRLRFPFDVDKRQPVGLNPPKGAIVYYYFKEAPKGEVTLEILDEQGRLVRKLSSEEKKAESSFSAEWPDLEVPEDRIPAEAGLNRFAWDLRVEGPRKLPGELMGELRSLGPTALPGKYQVRLTAGGKSEMAPLELRLDPRLNVSQADLQKQFDLSLKIREQISALHDAVAGIRETRAQLQALQRRFGDQPRYKTISEASKSLEQKMAPIEEELLQVKAKSTEANLNFPVLTDEQLHSLGGSVDSSDNAPTRQQYDAFEALSQAANAQIAKWKQVMDTDLAGLNDMIRKESVPVIYVAAPAGAPGSEKAAGDHNPR